MSKKVLFFLSIFLFILGLALVYPDVIGLCPNGNRSCVYSYPVFSIGEPLLFGSIPFILVTFILLFVHKIVFTSWKKFAIIYLPIAFLLIFTTPVSAGFLKMDRELMSL